MFAKKSSFGLMHLIGLAGVTALASLGAYAIVRMRASTKHNVTRDAKRVVHRVARTAKAAKPSRHTNHIAHA